jgi:hypothetical protein
MHAVVAAFVQEARTPPTWTRFFVPTLKPEALLGATTGRGGNFFWIADTGDNAITRVAPDG